jgi:small-conductance mechanosensitive channel
MDRSIEKTALVAAESAVIRISLIRSNRIAVTGAGFATLTAFTDSVCAFARAVSYSCAEISLVCFLIAVVVFIVAYFRRYFTLTAGLENSISIFISCRTFHYFAFSILAQIGFHIIRIAGLVALSAAGNAVFGVAA